MGRLLVYRYLDRFRRGIGFFRVSFNRVFFRGLYVIFVGMYRRKWRWRGILRFFKVYIWFC